MSQVVDPKSTGAYARAHQVDINPSNAKAVAQNNNSFSSNSSASSLLDIVGSANALNLASARETNEFNAREAQKNRDWQEYMSNTSHQREVQDLIKAGLNPILSVNNGASTPSGAVASGVKANTESGVNAIASIIGASINAGTQMAIANLNAKTNLEIAEMNNNTKYDTSFYGIFSDFLDGLLYGSSKGSNSAKVGNSFYNSRFGKSIRGDHTYDDWSLLQMIFGK